MHGKSAEERAGFLSMIKKDPKAQKAAVDEYFKHWDNKSANTETQETRDVSLAKYTRHGWTDGSFSNGKQNMLLSPNSMVPHCLNNCPISWC